MFGHLSQILQRAIEPRCESWLFDAAPSRHSGEMRLAALCTLRLVAGLVAPVAWVAWSGRCALANESAKATLDYAVDNALSLCPSRSEMEQLIAARLGYNPFVPSAADHVTVRLWPDGPRLHGRFVLAGGRQGQRDIASDSGDCQGVANALAASIAISLDPEAGLTSPPKEEPSAPSNKPPPAPEPARQVVKTTPAPTIAPVIRWHAGLGGTLDFNLLPDASLMLAARAGLQHGIASMSLRMDLAYPQHRSFSQTGQVETSYSGVGLEPCAHHGIWLGCVDVSIGRLQAEGSDVASPHRVTVTTLHAGLSAGIRSDVTSRLYIEALGTLRVPLRTVTFQLQNQEVWQSPSLGERVSLGLGVRF